ncbi:MAG: hypothetical protein V4793_47820, partial [Paraburkholderia tropica]
SMERRERAPFDWRRATPVVVEEKLYALKQGIKRVSNARRKTDAARFVRQTSRRSGRSQALR